MGFNFRARDRASNERAGVPDVAGAGNEAGQLGLLERARPEAMDLALLRLLRSLANCGLDAAARPLLEDR